MPTTMAFRGVAIVARVVVVDVEGCESRLGWMMIRANRISRENAEGTSQARLTPPFSAEDH
jgi:hypothetical protein